MVAAQARSLGIGCIFGGQTVGSFGRESKEDAEDIFGNTLTKVAMRLEDAGQSFELFQKTAGEVLVTQTSGFTRHSNAVLNSVYHDTNNASVEKRSRIDLLDIRDQREGQAHVFRGSTIVRAQLFYANVGHAREYRINRFIPVLPATEDAIADSQHWADPAVIKEAVAQIKATPCPPLNILGVSDDTTLMALRRERSNIRFAQGVIAHLLRQYDEKERATVSGLDSAINASARKPDSPITRPSKEPATADMEFGGWTQHSAPLNAYQSDQAAAVPATALHPLDDGPIQRIIATLDDASDDMQLDVDAVDHVEQAEKSRLAQARILQSDSLLQGSIIRSALHLRHTPALHELLTGCMTLPTQTGETTGTGGPLPNLLLDSALRDGLQQCEASAHGDSGTAEQQTEEGLAVLQGQPPVMSVQKRPTPQEMNHEIESLSASIIHYRSNDRPDQ